jgi:hypothetical protein
MMLNTGIIDHSGEGDKQGATCTAVPGASEGCVNSQLQVGKSKGVFGPTNNCQSFAAGVLRTCQLQGAPPARDATYVKPPTGSSTDVGPLQ